MSNTQKRTTRKVDDMMAKDADGVCLSPFVFIGGANFDYKFKESYKGFGLWKNETDVVKNYCIRYAGNGTAKWGTSILNPKNFYWVNCCSVKVIKQFITNSIKIV